MTTLPTDPHAFMLNGELVKLPLRPTEVDEETETLGGWDFVEREEVEGREGYVASKDGVDDEAEAGRADHDGPVAADCGDAGDGAGTADTHVPV